MNKRKSTVAILSAVTMTVGAVAQNNSAKMENKAYAPIGKGACD